MIENARWLLQTLSVKYLALFCVAFGALRHNFLLVDNGWGQFVFAAAILFCFFTTIWMKIKVVEFLFMNRHKKQTHLFILTSSEDAAQNHTLMTSKLVEEVAFVLKITCLHYFASAQVPVLIATAVILLAEMILAVCVKFKTMKLMMVMQLLHLGTCLVFVVFMIGMAAGKNCADSCFLTCFTYRATS